jgi:hypothetical protein
LADRRYDLHYEMAPGERGVLGCNSRSRLRPTPLRVSGSCPGRTASR